MKNDYLAQFYTIDAETGEYILEIALDKYEDIFNTWDSSVYRIRDLDASLKLFIEECSMDINYRRKVVLRFNINVQDRDEKLEKMVEESVRNYYNYMVFHTSAFLAFQNKRSAFYIVVSMFFLTLNIYLQSRITTNIMPIVILQCLTVGGWIFLWEAISILFIRNSDFIKKRRLYRRLTKSPVMFRNKKL